MWLLRAAFTLRVAAIPGLFCRFSSPLLLVATGPVHTLSITGFAPLLVQVSTAFHPPPLLREKRHPVDAHAAELRPDGVYSSKTSAFLKMTSKGDYLYTTCYICGCTGSNNYCKYIAKCSTCENLEHQYCMINQLREVPEDWRCDECQMKVKDVSKAPRMPFSNGKVKYIPLEALPASGAKTSCRRTSNACNQSQGGSKKSELVRPKEESISGKLCPKPLHSSKGCSPAKKMKPYKMLNLKQEVDGRDLVVVPQGVMVDSERPQTNLEAGKQAQQPPWKGSFNIQDKNLNACFGVKAHFWRKWMNDKAYKTFTRMPRTIQLKFKPFERIWPKVFNLQPPESTDIALYFDPSEDYRSRKDYVSLLEKMDSENLGLGCCIYYAYLLIFSSKKLSPALQQDKNGSPYLWGLFCRSRLLSSRSLALCTSKLT